jgi:hypothetical protein
VHAPFFAKVPDLHAWYMDLSPETWSSVVFGRYHSLRMEYVGWIAIALALVQRWLNTPADAVDVRLVQGAEEAPEKAPACMEA